MERAPQAREGGLLRFARRVRRVHPAAILVVLDTIGLAIASYLSTVELQDRLPVCGPLHGCETVAQSPYARIGGVPVAVFGVFLSITLLGLAIWWWRTNDVRLLAGHYVLSLFGVMFEGYFTYLELFVIKAVCIWCAAYGISLLLRFLVALVIWVKRDGGSLERRPLKRETAEP